MSSRRRLTHSYILHIVSVSIVFLSMLCMSVQLAYAVCNGKDPCYTLTVTKSGSGTGSVTTSTDSLTWNGNTGTASYDSGTPVTLTAAPTSGSTVTWGGDCAASGSNSTCTVTMSAAKNVTATFTAGTTQQYTIRATAGTGGSISCTPTSVSSGGSSTCTITPSTGYTLSGLTDNGTNVLSKVSNNTYTITNITSSHTVEATFSGGTTGQYTIRATAGTGGSISCTPTSVSSGGSSTCTITPSTGYTLSGLTDNGADVLSKVSNNTYTITNITSNHTVVATFKSSSTAGTVSLRQTGQMTSYYAGDDGALKKGVAWPNQRFTSNTDQTVTDNLTGLIWAKDAGTPTVGSCSGGKMTWQAALTYVACLNTTSHLGHNDWRLPNVNELESITNAGQADPSTWLNSQGFVSVQSDSYWSSTTYIYNNNTFSAWYVYMYNGGVFAYNKTEPYYVWPVRSGQSGAFGNAAIWQTGQTIMYATGDDGELQKGVVWPNPRFDDSNQVVTDNLTGLIWAKDASTPTEGSCTGGSMSWQAALDYVKCLNEAKYLNYSDWRLPNKEELFSLIDRSTSKPSISSGNPFINVHGSENISYDCYWSSTTYAVNASSAWAVGMYDGNVDAYGKTSSRYVWPVRNWSAPTTQYTVNATATPTAGGSISCIPTSVASGDSSTCTITPSTGYNLSGLTDNGADVLSKVSNNTYTITNITADHTVVATFTLSTSTQYTVNATATPSAGGSISCNPMANISSGGSSTCTITPSTGYNLSGLTDNGADVLSKVSNNTYTITNITADHTVVATFTSSQPTPGNKARYDFDGDGQSEILWRNSTTGDIVVWSIDKNSLNYLSRELAEKGDRIPGEWQVLAVEDFDGDGKSDILWENVNNDAVYIWFMNSLQHGPKDVYWIKPGTGPSSPRLWQIEKFGDFNGDGVADILWRHEETGYVAIWLMSAIGVSDYYYVATKTVADWQVKAVADFDSDGKADVLWQGTNDELEVWLIKDKNTTPSKATVGVVSSDWQFKAVGDFNGDGKADVLWQNTNGEVAIWLMDGLQSPTKKSVGKLPSDWQFRAVGDYNGDGTADILWQNTNGDLAVWIMKDSTINQRIYVDKTVPGQWQVIGR